DLHEGGKPWVVSLRVKIPVDMEVRSLPRRDCESLLACRGPSFGADALHVIQAHGLMLQVEAGDNARSIIKDQEGVGRNAEIFSGVGRDEMHAGQVDKV